MNQKYKQELGQRCQDSGGRKQSVALEARFLVSAPSASPGLTPLALRGGLGMYIEFRGMNRKVQSLEFAVQAWL